jgi:zinc/manganese transport system substrate-binding protein
VAVTARRPFAAATPRRPFTAAIARRPFTAAIAVAVACLLAAGCDNSATAGGGGLRIVAAENFWGSIAEQLGGSKASVQSIIRDPAQDPHSYEPGPADARALATARLVVVNGLGYDPWAPRLLAANPAPGRAVLNVGGMLGLKQGDNPHRWYDPADVEAVANALTARLKQLDPGDMAYFERQRTTFERRRLAYHQEIASISRRYAGVPVGASESIFALLSPSLGLRLITPPSFMKAISEGTDVTAQDTITTERQLSTHQIKVWVYNSQNTTPQIQRLNALARARGVPVASVTETLSPASDSFEQWQTAQLQALARALYQATGR